MVEVPLNTGDAMQHLQKFRLVDPQGTATVASVCRAGHAFEIRTDSGPLIYVQDVAAGVFWIAAAAGNTQGEAGRVLQHLEDKAKTMHCHRIGFQTMRRGLARIAKKRGYKSKDNGQTFTKEL